MSVRNLMMPIRIYKCELHNSLLIIFVPRERIFVKTRFENTMSHNSVPSEVVCLLKENKQNV